jgi:trk system potassium uptake protein TrkH
MRPLLANLGFILQVAGLFILIPILIAFYYGETSAVISLFITATVFLVSGFLLNALCERKELDFKSSCALITLTFILLGLIGSIPYLYARIFPAQDVFSEFSSSFFESVSGYTTTGLTMVENPDFLPKSIVFYRSLTQWIGGLGIVYLFLAFFYPGNAITKFSKAIGIESFAGGIKKTFISILLIYCLFTGIFILIFYLIDLGGLLNATSLTFSTISTGGFSPIKDLSSMFVFPNNLAWNFAMIIGATSFIIHYNFITRNMRKVLTSELLVFLFIIFFTTLLISKAGGFDLITSFFHTASASTTSGFSFLDLSRLENLKPIFIGIILLGGCRFSTAGGFKIMRLVLFLKSIPWAIKKTITGSKEKLSFAGKQLGNNDILFHLLFVLLGISIVFVSALIFSLNGFAFMDSLFEVSSAFATTGFSVGITSLTLMPSLKWLLTIIMILGRIEVLPFLIAIAKR